MIIVWNHRFATRNSKQNCSNSIKTLFSKLIFLLQLIMQNFLRQRLIIMSTKFVAKNILMLLFIEQFIIRTCLKMIKSFICCSFSKSIFAKSTFLLKTTRVFLTKMFCYVFIEIVVRSTLDVFDISIWKRNDHNRCFRIVFLNTIWI